MTKAKVARTRKLIAAIVRELNQSNRNLWWILTALRGPDSDDASLKNKTTAVIRGIVGLKQGPSGAIVNESLVIHKPKYGEYGTSEGHFEGHVSNAIEALEALKYKFTKN